MKTEYSVGNIRLHFESRARRRCFVALFYAVLAAFGLAGFSAHARTTTGAWIVAGCGILFTALFIVFTWIGGDMRTRGDEREMHRREHAHFVAYRILLYGFAAALFYSVVAGLFAAYFGGRNPITPPPLLALRGLLMQLPRSLLVAACLLLATLPQAILLWSEPDMDVNPELATE